MAGSLHKNLDLGAKSENETRPKIGWIVAIYEFIMVGQTRLF